MAALSSLKYDDLQKNIREARQQNIIPDDVKKAEGVLAAMDTALEKLRAATDRQPRDLGALQESLHSARQLGLQAHPVYRQCEEVFAGTCMPPGFPGPWPSFAPLGCCSARAKPWRQARMAARSVTHSLPRQWRRAARHLAGSARLGASCWRRFSSASTRAKNGLHWSLSTSRRASLGGPGTLGSSWEDLGSPGSPCMGGPGRLGSPWENLGSPASPGRLRTLGSPWEVSHLYLCGGPLGNQGRWAPGTHGVNFS